MRFRKLLPLTCIVLPLLLAQMPPGGDNNWPRKIDTDNIHLILYQPQVGSWKDNRIEARSAVIVMQKGDPTQIFGIVSISARAEVDRETRLVALEKIVVKEADFPSASSLQRTLLKAIRESVPGWPRTVSLDRLLADLAITQAETKAVTISLKNDPPRITFSRTVSPEGIRKPGPGARHTPNDASFARCSFKTGRACAGTRATARFFDCCASGLLPRIINEVREFAKESRLYGLRI